MKKWIFLSSLIFAAVFFSKTSFADKNFTGTTFFAEGLLWQVRESNATNWGQILYPNDPNETIQFLNVSFNFSPGLRIGVGFNGNEKPWNVLFYYTGYTTRGTSQASTDTGELHSSFSSNFYASNPQGNGITGPYYHRANITWDVSFNTLDLELGRLFTIDKLMKLRPFFGLKAGLINQSMNSNWFDPPPSQGSLDPVFSSATEKVTNNFKGIGPSVGMEASFDLLETSTQAFSVIGNFSGALMWSKWHFSDVYRNDTPQTIYTNSDDLIAAALMAKGYLGVEWSLLQKNVNWNVRLGYEEQAWFNQLQYYSFDMGKTNDTLFLEGAVLSVSVEF